MGHKGRVSQLMLVNVRYTFIIETNNGLTCNKLCRLLKYSIVKYFVIMDVIESVCKH